MAAMILAADVGGSKTLVGLFGDDSPRPRLVDARAVRTLDFDGLPALLDAYLAGHRGVAIDRAALGVAGPILDDEATMTNVPWRVRRREVAAVTGAAEVRLLNDLEAMAYAVPVLMASAAAAASTLIKAPMRTPQAVFYLVAQFHQALPVPCSLYPQ